MADPNSPLIAAARLLVQWGRTRQGAWRDASSDLLAALGNRYAAFQDLTQELPPRADDRSLAASAPVLPAAPVAADPGSPAARPPEPRPAAAPVLPPPADEPPALRPADRPPTGMPIIPAAPPPVVPASPPMPMAAAAPRRKAPPPRRRNPAAPVRRGRISVARIALAVVAVLVVLATPSAWHLYQASRALPPPDTNRLTIESVPPGSIVFVDGVDSGKTPVTVALPLGRHAVELRYRRSVRKLDVEVTSGTLAATRVDWTKRPSRRRPAAAVKAAPSRATAAASDARRPHPDPGRPARRPQPASAGSPR